MQIWIKLGAIFGGLSVMLGAFGAHSLKARLTEKSLATFQTGVLYQFIHSLALILVGLLAMHFVDEHEDTSTLTKPDFGKMPQGEVHYGVRATAPLQFAAERRRGWREAPDCPRRPAKDIFDQGRNAKLFRLQPGGALQLYVESHGWPGGELTMGAVEGLAVRYWLEDGQDMHLLEDLQWADWDAHGRLLTATRSGSLQIRVYRHFSARTEFEADLTGLDPQPVAAPKWAEEW